jgi:phenylalanine-4-hydroxylase
MIERMIPTLKSGQQLYQAYTAEDLEVWNILYSRQMQTLKTLASQQFLEGLDRLGFSANTIPNFNRLNEILAASTGWEIIAVKGIIADDVFFDLLAQKKFPATTWLRTMEELDYLEEPDMFHDIFGHIPLLTEVSFTHFLQRLGQIGQRVAEDAVQTHLLSRIYWYTVEFGLIREQGDLKIYGAGILSSIAESLQSVDASKVAHHAFDMKRIMNSPYRKDLMQEQYFILEDYPQLYEQLPEVEIALKA